MSKQKKHFNNLRKQISDDLLVEDSSNETEKNNNNSKADLERLEYCDAAIKDPSLLEKFDENYEKFINQQTDSKATEETEEIESIFDDIKTNDNMPNLFDEIEESSSSNKDIIKSKERLFRDVYGKYRNDNKSIFLALTFEKPGTLEDKNYVLDHLIDLIEPKYCKLYHYKRKLKGRNFKFLWEHSPKEKEFVIFNDSPFSRVMLNPYRDEKLAEELIFFTDEMYKNKCSVVAYGVTEKGRIAYERLLDILISIMQNETFEYPKNIYNEEPIKIHSTDKIYGTNLIKYNSYEEYKSIKKKLTDRIRKLHEKMIDKGKSLVIVFQGIDGAGKSSSIRRLISKMVPHWFKVYGYGAPTQDELSHHWLWRFYKNLPEKGEIVIFDRSYYERLTAERVLDLNNKGWTHAVAEIKTFEEQLRKRKIYPIRFWLNIDKDTQLERFTERETNPMKTWKISKADYETREKWDEYQVAFNDLINWFDWHLIDGTDKREARLNVIYGVCKEMESILNTKYKDMSYDEYIKRI